ncbi:hypothetical protein J4P02_15770 [Pseudomonas sp. NFXW11]|uniref:hypothetical protein n=1 Tax=Pseudomonas sp. NFXW11 TaxID=2819531 RepID=UPI003CEA8078
MGNMLRKSQVALHTLFSGDDPLRLFSLMLAAYLGISASAMHGTTASCCQVDSGPNYPTTMLPVSSEATLTLDDDAVIGRTALPFSQQQAAPRWVF